MRYITNILLKGLGAVLPIGLTLYLVYWLGRSLELLLRPVIAVVVPQAYYWPGMGLAAGLLLLFLVGLLVDAWIVQRLFHLGGMLLEKIPLIKSIYGGLRDFMKYFARMQEQSDLKTVVAVRFGQARLLGFITGSEEHKNLPGDPAVNELVAVYLPMSYQIGGFTVYVPREDLEHIDMSVEDAMRHILTAGLSQTETQEKKPAAGGS